MTRDELEQLDTESLLALARAELGGRGRGLRSRGELLAALRRSASRAPVRAAGSAPATPAQGPVPSPVGAGTSPPPAPGRPPAEGRPGEAPVEEGFFQVPRQGRRRRSAAPPPAVRAEPSPSPPGAPPSGEAPHLLARDPTTLFVFWDFRRDLERGAALGLAEPRVVLRLFEEDTLVRTAAVPLDRRSAYLEGLSPGHTYRVEAWLSGNDGHARPTGRRSLPLTLPPAVPSSSLDVRLRRVPWDRSLASWQRAPPGPSVAPRSEPLGSPARIDLPASLDWRGGGGPGGGPSSGRP
ncbi:MAG TPA: DUF4912 domain-containing protein [Myxococcaceae bacterium]|jgi:hypothetical protein|nr:DUF4912 domain-containing protein [Myxococcaceae bacterium]